VAILLVVFTALFTAGFLACCRTAFGPHQRVVSWSEFIGTKHVGVGRCVVLVTGILALAAAGFFGWLGAVIAESLIKQTGILGVGILGGLLGGLGGAAWAIWASGNRAVAHLRIVGLPFGEAPEAIRQAWIGVELPLRRWEKEPAFHDSVGVLSEQKPRKDYGYLVDGRIAVQHLAALSPEAAQWWRENAPHVLERGYRLLFPAAVCERV
jgi:hypothetical protein